MLRPRSVARATRVLVAREPKVPGGLKRRPLLWRGRSLCFLAVDLAGARSTQGVPFRHGHGSKSVEGRWANSYTVLSRLRARQQDRGVLRRPEDRTFAQARLRMLAESSSAVGRIADGVMGQDDGIVSVSRLRGVEWTGSPSSCSSSSRRHEQQLPRRHPDRLGHGGFHREPRDGFRRGRFGETVPSRSEANSPDWVGHTT